MIKLDLHVNIEDLKQGYIAADNTFCCLFCKQKYVNGDIYSVGNRLVDANTAIKLHIQEAHISSFNALIAEDKKVTGLSSVQSELMTYFYHGISDKDIALKTDTSPSTVRYQRFNLREKAKQAKMFLAIYELMEEKLLDKSHPFIHPGATMVDERYMTTDSEREKIITTFFSSQNPLVLKSFSPKEKKKLVILKIISEQFEVGKKYSEKEVNQILKSIYADYATIRRYLIEYGFMERTHDCNEYWLK
jgi:DNA-binding CsgD family transcriptional regulator